MATDQWIKFDLGRDLTIIGIDIHSGDGGDNAPHQGMVYLYYIIVY